MPTIVMILPEGHARPFRVQVNSEYVWAVPSGNGTVHAMSGCRLDDSGYPTGEVWTFDDAAISRAADYFNRFERTRAEKRSQKLAKRLALLPEDGSHIYLKALVPDHFPRIVAAYNSMLHMYPEIHVLRDTNGELVVCRNLKAGEIPTCAVNTPT
jgi:hypothetical protein